MKKVLKVIALVLALSMVVAFAACGGKETETTTAADGTTAADTTAADGTTVATDVDYSAVKIGFIFLHDENSTYDKNFMDAAKEVQAKLGLTDEQVLFKTNIPESAECYETACDFADAGCTIVFADSFGHEPFMVQAAAEYPNVQFCHATGDDAPTSDLANYHNAFASIYEGRYVAGVAAGLKLNAMIEAGDFTADQAKMGYIGAFPYAEVISGLSSFYLGAKSVCPTVTMEVKYTNSWFDIALEKEAAETLIASGCKLISQHADSEGAPKACEAAGVPNVAYNINTSNLGPNTAIISSKIDWAPYFELIINAVAKNEAIADDWCGGFKEGSVKLTELNTAVAAEGTQEKLDEVIAQLEAGTLHVFDTSTFTVNGAALGEDTLADVVPDEAYTPDTDVVSDGYFHESEFRSAPYFFNAIDGITGVIPE